MTAVIKMNRNRQINIPVMFIKQLSLGEDNYFRADIKSNQIILTPIDPVERVFSKQDLEMVEAQFQKEKKSSVPVTASWIKKTHH